jgi:aryl-phospho-beta-D-glucosidase BglC (GH1 family)
VNWKSSLSIFLLFAFLISIICPATFSVLGLQSNIGISSYGTINYSTTGPPSQPSGELHVDGKYLKDSSGNIVILRGVVFASDTWWSGATYNSASISENQFVYMKNWGCNAVRIGIQCYTLESITDSSGNIIDSTFLSTLDQIISWSQAHGLYVILCGFWPGGTAANGYLRVDCAQYMPTYWGGSTWSKWIGLWQFYANRYKGMNIMYEILSEPIDCAYATYQSRTRACIDAIRAIDSNCIVVVHSVDNTTSYQPTFLFEQTYPISRSNIVYTDHYYAYHSLSNTQQSIRNRLSYVYADWMIANGRCVIYTEFGGYGNGVDYSVHGWSASGVAAFSTPWLQNFMTVLDADGYSGYTCYLWATGDYGLLADWNGNPSGYGNVISTYYLAHPS